MEDKPASEVREAIIDLASYDSLTREQCIRQLALVNDALDRGPGFDTDMEAYARFNTREGLEEMKLKLEERLAHLTEKN